MNEKKRTPKLRLCICYDALWYLCNKLLPVTSLGKITSQSQWPLPLIQLLNTATRMPFETLFVMLIGAIVFPFALGIQCLHENENTARYSSSCIQLT